MATVSLTMEMDTDDQAMTIDLAVDGESVDYEASTVINLLVCAACDIFEGEEVEEPLGLRLIKGGKNDAPAKTG